jgi:hypothetical protein
VALGDQSVQKPALTLNDPAPLDNMSDCGLDIVRVARHLAKHMRGQVVVREVTSEW